MAMTTKQIWDLSLKYAHKILELHPDAAPVRHLGPKDHTPEAWQHMLYLCYQLADDCKAILPLGEGGSSARDKMMRWFAWLQAKLESHGVYTLADFKSHNKHPATVFRDDGGTPTKDFAAAKPPVMSTFTPFTPEEQAAQQAYFLKLVAGKNSP